jgi:hypothetical protein
MSPSCCWLWFWAPLRSATWMYSPSCSWYGYRMSS